MEIFGILGVIFITLSYIPQIIKLRNIKDASAISLTFYYSIGAALICFLIYSTSIRDYVFITSNSVGLIFTIITIFMVKNRQQ